MLCINNHITDVYFNLASEEYLLKQIQDSVFMIYRDKPAVVMGKHQIPDIEINLEYAEKNHIQIARRISGGGSVYHDLGNINFVFIEDKGNADFSKFTHIIVNLLSQIGIETQAGERNMIEINGLKISGCAQFIHQSKILHHGTLLFDSNLKHLSSVLKKNDYKPDYKYVKSVPSQVTNLKQHLTRTMNRDEFSLHLIDSFMQITPDCHLYDFNEKDILNINQLRNDKYASQEWIFRTFATENLLV